MKLKLQRIGLFVVPVLLIAGRAANLYAQFQSTQVEVVAAEATIGGIAPAPQLQGFQILHSPLQGVSNVTKIAIIEGAVGTNMPAGQAKYIPAQNVKAADATPVIRVRLHYRFVTPDSPDLAEIHYSTAIYYNDPSSFFFQIDPSLVVTGDMQYQILAERFDSNGVVISTFSIPDFAYGEPNRSWITIGVQAGAAPVIGSEGGVITITDGNPTDGQSSLTIPSGVFSGPTEISLNEVPLDQGPQSGSMPPPLAVYAINSQYPFNRSVRLSLLYPEFKPSASNWTLSGQRINEKDLTLAVWDGYAWHPIVGSIDKTNHLLTSRINYVPYVGVFDSGAPSPQSVAPTRKIITPNGDGSNDTADFNGLDPTNSVSIYDAAGNKIRTISAGTSSWDGRDDSGKIVESGVYIYQFSQGGQRMSGVIAVAK